MDTARLERAGRGAGVAGTLDVNGLRRLGGAVAKLNEPRTAAATSESSTLDADFTNSPILPSSARMRAELTPSSRASSWTRILTR